MEKNYTPEDIAEALIEYYGIKKETTNHIEMHSGERTTKKKFLETLTPAELKEIGVGELVFESNYVTKLERALNKITPILREKKLEQATSKLGIDIEDGDLDFQDFSPVVDIRNNIKCLYNRKLNKLSDICYDVWYDLLDSDSRELLHQVMVKALLTYDPYNLEIFAKEVFEGYNVIRINLYNPPKWRFQKVEAKIPDRIGKLLKHVFPERKVRRFVLNWIKNAVVNRNETYLVLNGKKGIGKGVFCTLVQALVGKDHYTLAPDSLLNDKFNSALKDKRVMVFDEFKVNKDCHTKLKRYINKHQSLEAKGKDATTPIEIFNSYIICNNDTSDMYVEVDDRRFSVVEMTDENLLEVMTAEEINNFIKELEKEDSTEVAQMGHFIMQLDLEEEFNEHTCWKGKRFYQLAYNSLREWQKYMVDHAITDEEAISLKKMVRMYNKTENKTSMFPRNPEKIKDFLKNYLHHGKYEIGELRISEDGWKFFPNSKDLYQGDTEPTNQGENLI